MKNFFQTTILMLIGILTTNFSANAQLYEVSLDEKIQQSSLIIEGKVIDQTSYRSKNGEVYTANKVKVSKVLKGNLPAEPEITVVTEGGTIDDVTVSTHHLLSLYMGEKGIFFLNSSDIDCPHWNAENGLFDTYSSMQGFLMYITDKQKNIVAVDPFHRYESIDEQVFEPIKQKTGKSAKIINGGAETPRTGIRYVFKNFTFNGLTVNFDIYVNGLYGSYKLYKSGIELKYNEFFGQDIVSNEQFELAPGEVATSTSYTLSTTDIAPNELAIGLSTTGSVTGLNTVTTNEKLFAKGKFTISNPLVEPSLQFDLSDIYPLNMYYDNQLQQHFPFDTIIFEIELRKNTCQPFIESFAPPTVAGGIGEIITIKGECFGEFVQGVSKVEFLNAFKGVQPNDWVNPIKGEYEIDCGLGSIYCWTDTLIKVKVPSIGVIGNNVYSFDKYAGTGPIMVCNKDSLCGTSFSTSEGDLLVKYSAENRWTSQGENPDRHSLPVTLRDANGEGGMSLKYDANFAGDTAAVNAFKRALRTWQCATGVNLNDDPNTGNQNAADSCIIRYEVLGAGILGATTLETTRCKYTTTNEFIQGETKRFTMKFNSAINWHKQEDLANFDSTEYDFQSNALHELGHVHRLNHVNQATDVMYYELQKGKNRRQLGGYNIEGGLHIMGISAVDYPGSNCYDPMSPIDTTGLDCYLLNAVPDAITNAVKLYLLPNPVHQDLTFHIESSQQGVIYVRIFDLVGGLKLERQYEKSAKGLTARVETSDLLPAGMYLFNVSDGREGSLTTTFIKL